MIYLFDESWDGFLTAVFDYFERKEKAVQLIAQKYYQPGMFDSVHTVVPDTAHAKRVWSGLAGKIDRQSMRRLYCAYLSELPVVYHQLFTTIIRLFSGHANILENYGDHGILNIAQTAKKVEREKHRMKAFIRFEKAGDNLFFASIEPDFNVIPLIIDFFKHRYADQPWLIYDLKRGYGVHYNRSVLSEVTIDNSVMQDGSTVPAAIMYDSDEKKYQELWKDYFKNTNIEARKNLKLHLQHVPKRYWKHLVEKSDKLKFE